MTIIVGLLAFIIPLILDQWTKYIALMACRVPIEVTSIFSCELVMNRGVSWSLFNNGDSLTFLVVTGMVAVAIAFLVWYTWYMSRRGQMILGELFVLSGACSNMIDRFVHHGVVDFIHLHYGEWSWPVFNVADAFIVLGVTIMIIRGIRS